MSRKLTNYERETIINFNEAEDTAVIFTYNRTWQKHLEKKLGLKPIMENGYGGKEYQIQKKRIRPPRAPVKLSPEVKARATERLRRNRVLSARKHSALQKSDTKNQNKDKNH